MDKKQDNEEGEDFTLPKIGCTFTIALQKARLKKGWSQKKLAQMLNIKQIVITQYETGKAIPNGQLIARLNRILDVKLPSCKKKKSKSSNKKI